MASVITGLALLADFFFFQRPQSCHCLLKAAQFSDSLLLLSLFHVSRSHLAFTVEAQWGGISDTINNIFEMFLKLLAVLSILLFKPAMTMMNIVQ